MKINFRQGIISHQSGGFLEFNGAGDVSILASNRPTTLTVAHGNSNYLHSEDVSVAGAWSGPFNGLLNYWLYWDFDMLTFERTFGVTMLEPVAQSVEPGTGNRQIVNWNSGVAEVGSFFVEGEYILPVGKSLEVLGSTGHDGTYTVFNSIWNGTTGQTQIIVSQSVADVRDTLNAKIIDGVVTLDKDYYGEPLLQEGRHWYNTVTNRHFVRQSGAWREVLRVFAAQIVNGITFVPQTITHNSFLGTQIGNTNPVFAGRVIFDEASDPIRRDNGTFFNTEDQFFANATRVDAIRLESNVARAQNADSNAMAQFTVVAWSGEGKIVPAEYEDSGRTVVGILTEDLQFEEVGGVIIQGVVTNIDWNWTEGSGSVPVGTPLYIFDDANHKGLLTPFDPHLYDGINHPVGHVPVARVLDKNTIVFEQGLGGKGDPGPAGSIENFPPAGVYDPGLDFSFNAARIGGVTLTTESSIPELAIVVSDQDPRLTDARTPLPHTHTASQVTYTPTGTIQSNNVQLALNELSSEKLDKAGGTMTGFLTLHADPTTNYHAATKHYVDSLVSGLLWLDPICMVSLISDSVSVPPTSPQYSDAYIVPGGASGAWAAVGANHVVVWDGTQWLDRGLLTALNPAGPRLGIAMQTTTTPSGSFTGQKNNIAVFDNTGSLSSIEVPVTNNAVYVCSNSSLHAFNQYAFDSSAWILFGGGSSITVDNVTTVLNGNVLSVKQFGDGGEVDAMYIQGQTLSDLDLRYAAYTHTHNATAINVTQYTTSPFWGTPAVASSVQLNTTNLQTALQEIYDEKASKTPLYNSLADLPPAANVHGMFAHVHNEGKAFYAHAGSWVEISSNDGGVQYHAHEIPYDMSYFISGSVLPDELLGSFVATRGIVIPNTLVSTESIAVSEVAPSGPNVTIHIKKQGVDVGTVQFATNATLGVVSFPSDVTLAAGEKLQLVGSSATADPDLKDITVNIVGWAIATPRP